MIEDIIRHIIYYLVDNCEQISGGRRILTMVPINVLVTNDSRFNKFLEYGDTAYRIHYFDFIPNFLYDNGKWPQYLENIITGLNHYSGILFDWDQRSGWLTFIVKENVLCGN